MKRTQISLTRYERSLLDAEAAQTGKSIAALIRDAVRATYGESTSVSDDLTVIDASFGSWERRDEDGAAYVERLRSGARLRARNE